MGWDGSLQTKKAVTKPMQRLASMTGLLLAMSPQARRRNSRLIKAKDISRTQELRVEATVKMTVRMNQGHINNASAWLYSAVGSPV